MSVVRVTVRIERGGEVSEVAVEHPAFTASGHERRVPFDEDVRDAVSAATARALGGMNVPAFVTILRSES